MKLGIIAHSAVHLRQQLFYQEVARQGAEVLVLCPSRWAHLSAQPQRDDHYELRPLPCLNEGDIYHFSLAGALDGLQGFGPDWLYIQQEGASYMARVALDWKETLKCKAALFVWENLDRPGLAEIPVLKGYDLVVCGNGDAERFVKPHNPNTLVLPQVGIDTTLFQPLAVNRQYRMDVGYVGRMMPEKGVEDLKKAWPTAEFLTDKQYADLPFVFNAFKLICCPSRETPGWREQSAPYVAVEAIACGTPVIVSDAGASPFWLQYCPGAELFPWGDVVYLRNLIGELLMMEQKRKEMGEKGREWVVGRWSNPVVAKTLLEVLHGNG